MKNKTQQPLKQSLTGPIPKSGKFHSTYMGEDESLCSVRI